MGGEALSWCPTELPDTCPAPAQVGRRATRRHGKWVAAYMITALGRVGTATATHDLSFYVKI